MLTHSVGLSGTFVHAAVFSYRQTKLSQVQFFVDLILPTLLGPSLIEPVTENEYQGSFVVGGGGVKTAMHRAEKLVTFTRRLV